MQGSLGIGANISKWNDEEMATAKRLIAAYHQVQATIVQGDLYRLDFAAEWERVLGDADGESRQEPVGGVRVYPFDAGGARVSAAEAGGAGSEGELRADAD